MELVHKPQLFSIVREHDDMDEMNLVVNKLDRRGWDTNGRWPMEDAYHLYHILLNDPFRLKSLP